MSIRRSLLGNGTMLGAVIGNMPTLAVYASFLLVWHVTDPVAWGLVVLTGALTNMLASVGAELSDAIRSRQP